MRSRNDLSKLNLFGFWVFHQKVEKFKNNFGETKKQVEDLNKLSDADILKRYWRHIRQRSYLNLGHFSKKKVCGDEIPDFFPLNLPLYRILHAL